MVTSINWYSRESRKWIHTKGASNWLWRWSHWLVWGKPRELNWSSLAGTCILIYYYMSLYIFVPDLPMTVLEYSGI